MIIFKDFCGFSKKYSIQSPEMQEKGAKDAKNVELWGNKMQSAKCKMENWQKSCVRLLTEHKNYIKLVGTDVPGGPRSLRLQNAYPSVIYNKTTNVKDIYFFYLRTVEDAGPYK